MGQQTNRAPTSRMQQGRIALDNRPSAIDRVPPLILGYSVGYCAGFAGDLQSPQMAQHSTTLKVGDRAPDFSLASANGMGEVSLGKLRERGPVVVEFLRGTW